VESLVSRASIFLNYSRSQLSSHFVNLQLLRFYPEKPGDEPGFIPSHWDVSSQDFSIISKIASMSAKNTGDFLRLPGELAENFDRAPARNPPFWPVPFF